MIETAIAKGLTHISITDHYDRPCVDYPADGTFDPDAYFRELTPLKAEYAERIRINIGVEIGLQPHLGDHYRQLLQQYDFDFVIGSVHVMNGHDPAFRQVFEGHRDPEVFRAYFVEVLKNIRAIAGFQTLGHLDYVVRYGWHRERDYVCRDYRDILDEILRSLVQNGQGLEVNTAGLKYGLAFPHPQADILKRYRELGGELVTVGADAHEPAHIAYDFEQANAYLKSCGFHYYTVFEDRKAKFCKL